MRKPNYLDPGHKGWSDSKIEQHYLQSAVRNSSQQPVPESKN
jgi:hypothetical protein